MTPDRWQLINNVFQEAVNLDSVAREKLLDDRCTNDSDLRAEIIRLLEADEAGGADDFGIDVPKTQVIGSLAVHQTVKLAIPGYSVLHEIHRGGQGVVYQAVQHATKRKVAVKVLLEGAYASAKARRRFEREIELVASLKHPHIISVFHSGETTDGRLFCVMDYIRGVPLTQYVQDNNLSLEEALKLFRMVCDAVNYAHQKGVIHRDLKPSNILVDSDGTAKVLDFGLAKMVGGPEHSLISLTGQVMGTLPYMSPEQTLGNPDEIDTRTDVYALGVVLYEMLTGGYPYPAVGQMADVLKHIAETEPTPPSNQWTSDSGISARSGKRLKVGDCPIDDEVQTIVFKSLAKRRQRRYQGADDLARDISHYLAGEPIEAKRDSRWYVLKKTVRRYRVAVATTVAFVVVVIAGLVVSLTLWRQAETARTDAQQRADELDQVAEFQSNQFSSIDPPGMGLDLRAGVLKEVQLAKERSGLTADEIDAKIAELEVSLAGANFTNLALHTLRKNFFEPALKAIENDFGDQPLVQARLYHTVAGVLLRLGMFDQAKTPQVKALDIRRRILGDEHPDTLASMDSMGVLLLHLGEFDEAKRYTTEALDGRRRNLGYDHADALRSTARMGSLLRSTGRFKEAKEYYQTALAGFRDKLGENHEDTLSSLSNMGAVCEDLNKLDEAEQYYLTALTGLREKLGGDHPDTLTVTNNLGPLMIKLGRPEEAEHFFREALDGFRRRLGDDHLYTLILTSNMGGYLKAQGRVSEAMLYYQDALGGFRRNQGDMSPYTLQMIANMGGLLQELGQFSEAEPLFREALNGNRTLLGAENRTTLTSFHNMGILLQDTGRLDEAHEYLSKSLQSRRRVLGDNDPDTCKSINDLGGLLLTMNRSERALEILAPAEATIRNVYGDSGQRLAVFLLNLGQCQTASRELQKAELSLIEAHSILGSAPRAVGDELERVAGALVTLYEQRHSVDLLAGYDARAAEWRVKLKRYQNSDENNDPEEQQEHLGEDEIPGHKKVVTPKLRDDDNAKASSSSNNQD